MKSSDSVDKWRAIAVGEDLKTGRAALESAIAEGKISDSGFAAVVGLARKERSVCEMVRVYNTMKEAGGAGYRSYLALLLGFGALRQGEHFRAVLADMKASGFKHTAETRHALVVGLIRCKFPGAVIAKAVDLGIKELNGATDNAWARFVSAVAQSGRAHLVQTVVSAAPSGDDAPLTSAATARALWTVSKFAEAADTVAGMDGYA
jgi:hypothetical protein